MDALLLVGCESGLGNITWLCAYLTCRPVLLTSEGCLASQDPGIIGWMGWLSNSLSCRSWPKSGLGWHWLSS